ncbi:Coiled-coil domain-containing protein 47 [Sparganum proliferum]
MPGFRLPLVLIFSGFLLAVVTTQNDDDFNEFINPDEDSIISVVGDADGPETEARDIPKVSASSPHPHGEQAEQRDSHHADTKQLHRHDNEENEEFFDDGVFDTQEPITGHEAASTAAYMESVDEEFEGFVEPPAASPQADLKTSASKDSAQPELKIAKAPHHVFRSWDCYTLELLLLGLIFVYLVNFIIGRGTNSRIANAWFAAHKELFESNFALVGDDGQPDSKGGSLTKESESLYSLWCSGRVCCEGMLVELRLLKRHDLFSVILNWLKPVNDSIVVKVVMDDNEMDSWVLGVGNKRVLSALTKEHFDLATYPQDRRGQRYSGLPEPLLILSEIPEATAALLNPTVCKIISDHQSSLDYLYFSDQYCGPKMQNEDLKPPKPEEVQKVLIFSFIVGSKGVTTLEDMESIRPLFNFIFYMIEKVRRLRLTKDAKAKSERARQRVNDTLLKSIQAQRQEAAQNRRDEQRRATKERIMAEEDPEKARKLEEREQKKERKRSQPRMKMMKVKGM